MKVFRRFWLMAAGAVLVLGLAGIASAAGLNVLTNGDFETGSLAPWTPFTTSNGTNGVGLPDVVSFDTTGRGASDAAHFNVGQAVLSSNTDYQGGGIYQGFFGSGTYTVSADIAAYTSGNNESCGRFDLLFDGEVVASHDFGGFSSIPQTCVAGDTYRAHLSAVVTASPRLETHTVAVQITRPFLSFIGGTPDEYVDNISAVRKLTRVS